MLFTQTSLNNAYVIEIEKKEDERGFFARSWDKKIFEKNNLETKFVQDSVAFSKKRGTLRGMHFQLQPYQETKLIRCTSGRIIDIIIDIRRESKTFKQWTSVELSANNHKMIYVPKGFAHGYQTLEDDTEVYYQITQIHMPDYEDGIHWNDPEFSITWPIENKIISKKDDSWSFFNSKKFSN
jgi:dTDP-4-dehydrorhamnose 3,5-epimerase